MTKQEALTWLITNFHRFDFSMQPPTIKTNFEDKQYLSWLLLKRDFKRRNAKNELLSSLFKRVQVILNSFEIEKHKNRLIELKKFADPPILQTFSIEEIESRRRNHYLWLNDYLDSSLAETVQKLSELLSKYPESTIDFPGYDEPSTIITGIETFEEAKKRLIEEAKLAFDSKLKAHQEYLRLKDLVDEYRNS